MIKDEILRSFQGKNAIVTGGTGLIGRQIVSMLCEAGAHVRIISLDKLNVDSRAEHILGDLTDFEFCKKELKNTDFVFHLAGIKASVEVAKTKIASHFVPTLMFNMNVLEACRLNKVGKIVYTSSIGAYSAREVFQESEDLENFGGAPMDFAGWAKRMGELQIYAYKIEHGLENFSIVRPSNVYGPGDNFDPKNAMVIPSLMCRILQGQNPLRIWGDGSAVRDFTFSRDVAEGIILAIHHGTKGRYVNLGCGRGYSVRELAETLRKFIDFSFVFDPTKPSGVPKRIMDITLARNLIDYDPTTTLEEGLRETWYWFLAHENEYKQKKNYFVGVES